METTAKPSPPIILSLLLAAVGTALWIGFREKAPKEERPSVSNAIELQVLCFNIRNGYGKDGDNRWENRKDFVAEVIANDAYVHVSRP